MDDRTRDIIHAFLTHEGLNLKEFYAELFEGDESFSIERAEDVFLSDIRSPSDRTGRKEDFERFEQSFQRPVVEQIVPQVAIEEHDDTALDAETEREIELLHKDIVSDEVKRADELRTSILRDVNGLTADVKEEIETLNSRMRLLVRQFESSRSDEVLNMNKHEREQEKQVLVDYVDEKVGELRTVLQEAILKTASVLNGSYTSHKTDMMKRIEQIENVQASAASADMDALARRERQPEPLASLISRLRPFIRRDKGKFTAQVAGDNGYTGTNEVSALLVR
jgi:hypothetical protein